jgi:Tfp pilus assembly protein PilN
VGDPADGATAGSERNRRGGGASIGSRRGFAREVRIIRITVNLARQPAENLRRVRMLWGGALATLLVALIALAAVAISGLAATRPLQAQLGALQARTAPLEAAQTAVEEPLRDAAVRAVLERSRFFNQLIDRKSISWTRLFERLEQIMPAQVELESLRPLQRQGASAVDIRFASETLPPAIEFVHRLETSSDFSGARVEREAEAAAPAMAAGGLASARPRFQIEVTALYSPPAETPSRGPQ